MAIINIFVKRFILTEPIKSIHFFLFKVIYFWNKTLANRTINGTSLQRKII